MLRWIQKHHLVLILLLGLAFALPLLNAHLVPAGDNSTYLVLAQSLATGQGYRMISDPRAPQMGLYPPGYSLLLAGVTLATSTTANLLEAILPSKILSVFLYLATVALVYLLLLPRSRLLAALTALATAVNPALLHFATEVGTELPYLLLSLACLWAYDRYVHRESWRQLGLTALLIVLAFYVRSIALAIAVALALHLVLRRRLGQAAVLLLVVGVLVLPWFVRGASLPDTGTSVGLGRGYFDLYFTSDPYGTAPASLSDWTTRLLQNVSSYVLDIWPNTVFPHASRLVSLLGTGGTILVSLITVLIAYGYVLELKRRSATEWYAGLFFLSCVTYMWAQSRLIVPIIPFAIYYLFVAAQHLLERLVFRPAAARPASDSTKATPRERTTGLVLGLGCAVLVASALVVEVRRVQTNVWYGWHQPLQVYYSPDPEWDHYLQAMEWIKANGEASSIVMCRKADLMYIVTGLQALEYPYSYEPADLKSAIADNKVDYLIEDAFSWTGTTTLYLQPALSAWQQAEPQALSMMFETEAPVTRVWRSEKPN